jgi:hypothetical protein
LLLATLASTMHVPVPTKEKTPPVSVQTLVDPEEKVTVVPAVEVAVGGV